MPSEPPTRKDLTRFTLLSLLFWLAASVVYSLGRR